MNNIINNALISKKESIQEEKIKPFYAENNIPVIFSTDKNFVPFVGIAIKSVIENSSDSKNYDFIILYSNISKKQIKTLKSMEKENVSIRFYNMSELMKKYKQLWYIRGYWSDAVYYRFFIPQLCSYYDKILFLDGDIIVNCDIAELYNIELNDSWIGAIQDIAQQISGCYGEEYRENVLKIKRENYINAGVLCLNIKELIKQDFTKLCIETLQRFKNPIFQDQDIINFVCRNHIKYLPYNYNLMWNGIHGQDDFRNKIKKEIYEEYINTWNDIKIIHYAGGYKPWNRPDLTYSNYFWQYAKLTPYYMVLKLRYIVKKTMQTIFSITKEKNDDQNYKVITILGFKIKYKIS